MSIGDDRREKALPKRGFRFITPKDGEGKLIIVFIITNYWIALE